MAASLIPLCFFGISLLSMIACVKFIKADRKLKLIVYFAIIGEVFGIMPRTLTIISGYDKVLGGDARYFTPTIGEINQAMWLIIVFNIAFIFGIFFISIQIMVMRERFPRSSSLKVTEVMSEMKMSIVKKTLIFISIPGVFLTLITVATGGTLLTNSDLEASRIDVSGTGPLIFIKEIPVTALLLWFAINKGKVGKNWLVACLFVIGIPLLLGIRSIMVTAAIMILVLYLLNNGYKRIYKRIHIISLISVVVFYLGWITFLVRGNLLRTGGSFWFWVKEALTTSPLDIVVYISQGSFNGFDGLINIVRYVPSRFEFHYGRFWYESITFLIPRALWHGKWDLQLTNLFTGEVFGWSQGGIFVTAPGVLFIDSGWIGVTLGACVIGAIITLVLHLLGRLFQDQVWIRDFCFACCVYFIFRFMFAGGSNDVGIVQRLIIEAVIILFFVKFSEAVELKYRSQRARENLSLNKIKMEN